MVVATRILRAVQSNGFSNLDDVLVAFGVSSGYSYLPAIKISSHNKAGRLLVEVSRSPLRKQQIFATVLVVVVSREEVKSHML